MVKLLTSVLCLTFATSVFGKHLCNAPKELGAPKEIRGLASVIGEIGSELNSDEENAGYSILCQKMYDSTKRTDNPVKKLQDAIIEVTGQGQEILNRKKFISTFVNTNNIVCNKNSAFLIRDNEPFLKRSISSGNTHFIREIGDEEGYDIDFNAVEIVNGEEETVLDYLYNILESPELRTRYDNDDIEDLIEIVEENGGIRKQNG